MYKVQLSIPGVGSVIAINVPFNFGLACVPAACLAEVYFSLRWVMDNIHILSMVGCGIDFKLEWPEW